MKKRLVFIFVVLVGLIFIVSGCEQIVGRRVSVGDGVREGYSCRQGQVKCGTQQECGGNYPCSFVCNEPLPRGGYVYSRYSCGNFGCSDGRCVEPKCRPLIPNHNNLNENRINMIFVGLNYEDVNQFKNRVLDVLDVMGNSSGFFAEPPFARNQDKFNFWYVNEVKDYDEGNYNYPQELLSKCNYLNLNNKQEITFINHLGRSSAVLGEGFTLFDGFLLGERSNEEVIGTFLHEFGHSFGSLLDEYLHSSDYWFTYYDIGNFFNIGLANEDQACTNWCRGEPIPLEEFKDFDCSEFETMDECDYSHLENGGRWSNNKPCSWVNHLEECKNIVDLCSSSNDQDICSSYRTGGDLNFNLCVFGREGENPHPYFNSLCLPLRMYGVWVDPNIGTQCIESTGCFKGASSAAYFRSSYQSKMKNVLSAWGYVNEKILREKLVQFGGRRAPRDQAGEKIPYTLFYDEFGENGEVVDGGMICLDCMEEETRNALLTNVNQSQKVSIFDNRGSVDYKKINSKILINEYKKLDGKKFQTSNNLALSNAKKSQLQY